KYKVPDNWNYKEARDLFLNPSVSEEKPDFKWKSPNTEELINFLVDEKGFSDERVRNGIKRIEKNISKPIQSRLDSFFKISKKKTLTDSQTSPSSAKKIKTK
ncbi:MAG: Elongation of fatty acids protein 2, partial [Paramarteilia canceri]